MGYRTEQSKIYETTFCKLKDVYIKATYTQVQYNLGNWDREKKEDDVTGLTARRMLHCPATFSV